MTLIARLLLSLSLLLPPRPGLTAPLPPPGADAPRFADLNPFDLLAGLGAEAERDRGQERDIAALAARLATPEASFAYLRDRVALEAYPGIMRGALGTLLAGAGNAFDRALLLAALLEAQGVETRLAQGRLPPALAERLLDQAVAAPHRLPEPQSLLWEAVRRRAAADEAALRTAALPALQRTIRPARLRAAAQADLAQHAWVEARIGGRWLAMDPSLPDAEPGRALARPVERHAAAPESWFQRVTFRVVTEQAEAGRLTRAVALEIGLPTAEASRARLALFFQPVEAGAGAALGQALGQRRHRPIFAVNEELNPGEAITLQAAPAGDGRAGGFGALLGALEVAPGDVAGPELAGLFLEAVLEAPGQPPLTRTRTLLDRLAPEARARDDGAAGTLRPLEAPRGTPSAFGEVHFLHLYDGAHDIAGLAEALRRLAGETLMRFAELSPEEGAALDLPAKDALLLHAVTWRALPLLSDLVAAASLNDLPDLRAHAARPRIAIVTGGGTPDGEGIALTTDLLQDELRFLPGREVPAEAIAERQLRFGALQAALEIELLATAWASFTGELAPAFDTPTGLGPLRRAPADSGGAAQRRAQAAGRLVLTARAAGREGLFWEIDPATGATRGVAEPGLGAGRARVPKYMSNLGAVHHTRAEIAARTGSLPGRVFELTEDGRSLREVLDHGERIARRLDDANEARRAAASRHAVVRSGGTTPVAGEYVSSVEVAIESSAIVAGAYFLFVLLGTCWGLATIFEALTGRL